MEKRTYIIISSVIIALLLVAAVFAVPRVASLGNDKPATLEGIVSSCANLGLKNSSQCVLDATKSFYKYNIDNLDKTLTFDELKDQGGVCSNWSEYYTELGKDLGFSARNVIVPTAEDTAHEFSVWSSDEGYCILDQTKAMCVALQ